MTRGEHSIVTEATKRGLDWLKKNHSEKYRKLKRFVLINKKKKSIISKMISHKSIEDINTRKRVHYNKVKRELNKLKNLPRCTRCSSVLKEEESELCNWCLNDKGQINK